MSAANKCFFCLSKFSIFKKQLKCMNCGYSACSDCLPHKISLKKSDQELQRICRTCYKNLTTNKENDGRVSPPANFKRHLQSLESSNVKSSDEDLEKRLKKLKESSKPQKDISMSELETRARNLKTNLHSSMTAEELQSRLDKLKGNPPPPAIRVLSIKKRNVEPDQPSTSSATSSAPEDDATQIKKLIRQYTDDAINFTPSKENPVEDLISKAMMEVEQIEAEDKEIEEMQKRVKNLGFNHAEMDDETAKLIEKILEEDRIESLNLRSDDVLDVDKKMKKSEDDEEEELPWCFMCNEDATIRCLVCEDLYCRRCFKEVHNEEGMRNHQHKVFDPSKKFF